MIPTVMVEPANTPAAAAEAPINFLPKLGLVNSLGLLNATLAA